MIRIVRILIEFKFHSELCNGAENSFVNSHSHDIQRKRRDLLSEWVSERDEERRPKQSYLIRKIFPDFSHRFKKYKMDLVLCNQQQLDTLKMSTTTTITANKQQCLDFSNSVYTIAFSAKWWTVYKALIISKWNFWAKFFKWFVWKFKKLNEISMLMHQFFCMSFLCF